MYITYSTRTYDDATTATQGVRVRATIAIANTCSSSLVSRHSHTIVCYTTIRYTLNEQ